LSRGLRPRSTLSICRGRKESDNHKSLRPPASMTQLDGRKDKHSSETLRPRSTLSSDHGRKDNDNHKSLRPSVTIMQLNGRKNMHLSRRALRILMETACISRME